MTETTDPHIGTLSEKSLHAALKEHYGQPGDHFEQRVDGYVIDIVQSDRLVEIQTSNFTAMRSKLNSLLKSHVVHVVHPIPESRWIVRLGADGQTVRTRRKSPRRGSVYDLFFELVRIPAILQHPLFSLETVLIHEEVILVNDGQGSWRRKGWSVQDRRLLKIVEKQVFTAPTDMLRLLPDDLPDPFTNRELVDYLDQPDKAIQKMTYTLRKMDLLEVVGKRGRAYLFSINRGEE